MVSAGAGDAWAYARKKVQLWSVPDGVLLRTLTERHNFGLGVSSDGRRFAFAEPDINDHLSFKIQVWSIRGDLEATLTLTGVQEFPHSIAISADGKLLAYGSAYPPGGVKGVKLWSVPDKTLIDLPVQARSVNALRISPDGRWLAATLACPDPPPTGSCFDGGINLWSLPDGRLRRTTRVAEQTYALAIAPHGEWLAEGFYHIRLWSLPDGKLLPACFIKKEASYPEAKLIEYTRDGVTYSLPCGSPLPTRRRVYLQLRRWDSKQRRRWRLLVSELRLANKPAEGHLGEVRSRGLGSVQGPGGARRRRECERKAKRASQTNEPKTRRSRKEPRRSTRSGRVGPAGR